MRFRSKIASVVEAEGVEVDNEMSSDLRDIVSEESPNKTKSNYSSL